MYESVNIRVGTLQAAFFPIVTNLSTNVPLGQQTENRPFGEGVASKIGEGGLL